MTTLDGYPYDDDLDDPDYWDRANHLDAADITQHLVMFVDARTIRDTWPALEGGLDAWKLDEAARSGMLQSIAEIGVRDPVVAALDMYDDEVPTLGNGHHRTAAAAHLADIAGRPVLVPIVYTDGQVFDYSTMREDYETDLPNSYDVRFGDYDDDDPRTTRTEESW